MKIRFFIVIAMIFQLSGCTDAFTRNIGKDITPGDQMIIGNHSTILDTHPDLNKSI